MTSFVTVLVSVSVRVRVFVTPALGSGLQDSLIQHRLSGPKPWQLKPARDGWQ